MSLLVLFTSSSFLRDELLVGSDPSRGIHLILFLKELLSLSQDVLQLSQLEKVLLQLFCVLVDLLRKRVEKN